jgi:hypothetical protein
MRSRRRERGDQAPPTMASRDNAYSELAAPERDKSVSMRELRRIGSDTSSTSDRS